MDVHSAKSFDYISDFKRYLEERPVHTVYYLTENQDSDPEFFRSERLKFNNIYIEETISELVLYSDENSIHFIEVSKIEVEDYPSLQMSYIYVQCGFPEQDDDDDLGIMPRTYMLLFDWE